MFQFMAQADALFTPSLLKDWGTAGIVIGVLVFGAMYVLPKLMAIGKDLNQASERLSSMLARGEVVMRRAEEMYPPPKIKTKYAMDTRTDEQALQDT